MILGLLLMAARLRKTDLGFMVLGIVLWIAARPGVNVVVLEPRNSRTPVTDIVLIPFSPASPSSLGMSGDTRKLGVGLVKIEAYD